MNFLSLLKSFLRAREKFMPKSTEKPAKKARFQRFSDFFNYFIYIYALFFNKYTIFLRIFLYFSPNLKRNF